MPKLQDISGKRMGRLIAIESTGKKVRGNYIWRFQCDCGNTTEIPSGNFNSGHTEFVIADFELSGGN